MKKQATKIWEIDARDSRGKGPKTGAPLVLAFNATEASRKAQEFLDKLYGEGKFQIFGVEHDGDSIDVF